MYFSIGTIKQALAGIERVHVFYGTTFLAFKRGNLPIGQSTEFAINSELRKFMDEYYKPFADSKYYYRAFRHVQKDNHWLRPNWPSTSAQSTMTRDFISAFHHDSNSRLWGWREDYVEILRGLAPRTSLMPVPMFYLAVWLFRERDWPASANGATVIKTFIEEFNLVDEELRLFDSALPNDTGQVMLFQSVPLTPAALTPLIGTPPDAPQEEGGTLAYLELQGIGPSAKLSFTPAERLSLITGDNGLGKSFLLECAWWALTGEWAGLSAYPRSDAARSEPKITYRVAGELSRPNQTTVRYDWDNQRWPSPRNKPAMPGLLIYARVDGSFAVFDPAQNHLVAERDMGGQERHGALVLSRDQVWNGLEDRGAIPTRTIINGLIRDIVQWQFADAQIALGLGAKSPLRTFQQVLRRLSPDEMGPLTLGNPVRLPYDRKDIPTLQLPYGEVPIVHAAAGMQRILALAYLIVWAWEEHKTQSQLARRTPQRNIVIMVDELEAHLHPRWQRRILPALLEVSTELTTELQVQYLITTHSPLVLTSVEPFFDRNMDGLFQLHLAAEDSRSQVELQEVEFVRQGSSDAWLTSEDVFGLATARSVEAENAIEQAKELQSREIRPTAEEVQQVSDLLIRYLAQVDDFWPRWTYFAEQHGAKI